jgi:hypothetical protein
MRTFEPLRGISASLSWASKTLFRRQRAVHDDAPSAARFGRLRLAMHSLRRLFFSIELVLAMLVSSKGLSGLMPQSLEVAEVTAAEREIERP